MSKGSRQRPYDVNKFQENFDRIFGRKDRQGNAKPVQVHVDKKKEQKKKGVTDYTGS